jgi:hypothetical protein
LPISNLVFLPKPIWQLIQSIGNRKSEIENPSANGWPTPAAPLKFGKATPTWKPWRAHHQSRNEIYGLLLATFSNHSVAG